MNEINRFKRIVLISLFFQLLLPAQTVLADTGPKPTMDFEFQQEFTGPPVAIISGVLLECQRPDCVDATPMEELGPQRFTCDPERCHAMAYGFSPYHVLEIHFSDGITRRSNIFETAGFNAKYLVTIREQDLTVEAQSSLNILPRSNIVLLATVCVCIFFAALLGGLVFYLLRRRHKP